MLKFELLHSFFKLIIVPFAKIEIFNALLLLDHYDRDDLKSDYISCSLGIQ